MYDFVSVLRRLDVSLIIFALYHAARRFVSSPLTAGTALSETVSRRCSTAGLRAWGGYPRHQRKSHSTLPNKTSQQLQNCGSKSVGAEPCVGAICDVQHTRPSFCNMQHCETVYQRVIGDVTTEEGRSQGGLTVPGCRQIVVGQKYSR